MASRRMARRKTASRRSQGHARRASQAVGLSAGVPAHLQRKLAVGKVDDPQEKEADSVADRVVSRMAKGDEKIVEDGGDKDVAPEEHVQTKALDEQEDVQRKAKEIVAPEVTEEQPEPEVQAQRAVKDKDEAEGVTAGVIDDGETDVQQVRRSADDTDALQRSATSDVEAPGDVEHRINQSRGSGNPLPPDVRTSMESSFGQDFGHVRTHTDDSSQQLSDDLNARAFTVGRDVYFNTGEFSPRTPAGRHLLAHELTHVVQQGGATPHGAGPAGATAQRVVRRAPQKDFEGSSGSLRFGGGKPEMRIEEIEIPKFKAAFMPPRASGYEVRSETRDTSQASVWKRFVRSGNDAMKSALESKLTKAVPVQRNRSTFYFLKVGGTDQIISGTKANVLKAAITPSWNKSGTQTSYDIDHKLENQVGGGDTKDNLWLLESRANQDSGRKVYAAINAGIARVLKEAADAGFEAAPDVASARAQYKILVLGSKGKGGVDGKAGETQDLGQVQSGSSIKPLKPLSKAATKKMQGSPKQLVILSRRGRGKALRVPWKEDATSMSVKQKFLDNFDSGQVTYDKASGKGSITGTAFKRNKVLKPVAMNMSFTEDPIIEWGGSLDSGSIPEYLAGKLDAKGMSPVTVEEAGVDAAGLWAKGKLQISVPMLNGVTADFAVQGNNVTVSKTFSKGDFKNLGPIKIDESTLTLKVGTGGLGADGDVAFSVPKLGSGRLAASSTTKGRGGSFSLDGSFDVEQDLFDPAKIKIKYADGVFSGGGAIGIKSGTIKGIRSASANVKVESGAWSADGSVVPDVPGVEQTKLDIAYAEATGLKVGGEMKLAKIKGLNGGTLTVEVIKQGEAWKAKGKGSADLAVPGLTKSSVTVAYDDGLFEAAAELGYSKGMLEGTIRAGVTNRPVGEDGKPAGEPGKGLTIFGSGTMTITIAPWLQGSIGVTLKPDGGIKVRGEIGLPSALDIFPEKRFDKNLLSVGFDIPILGFAVAGQRVGVFLTVGGGVDLSAGIGPGQLREAKLSIDYDPAAEADTKVSGAAEFVVPADAGVKLSVHAGIGAGIPVVSATAGLDVSGEVGLKGEAKAAANVDWTPAKGLALHAFGDLSVQPKFQFAVNGFALVEADLWIKTIELYRKNWNLASFEYGSDLEFGVRFPIDYVEGEAFSMSMDDLEFRTPDVDPKSVLKGIVDKIK